jgi:uncharacterized repeat protein (TIGR01451 family)/fimbrial isopeptide formation D2 family protein
MLSRFLRNRLNGSLVLIALVCFTMAWGRAAWAGQNLLSEVEPNGTSAAATPIVGTNVVIRANVFPAADVDFYSFSATTGDRVYAAVQTVFDGSASGDSVLDVLNTDGTTVIENDPNDGTFNASSSTVAGTLIPSTGTFFLRVRHNVATGTIRPYDLHFNRLTGTPVAEVESNNTPATANPVPASGWISGTITAVAPGESDFFSINLNAGDSVYLSLDMNPERDAAVWNGRLGFSLFGNPPANQVLIANDANAGATATDPNSEAFFFTVLTSGTYFVYVDSIVAAGLGANATYHLSVAVHPATPTCTTYTSTNVPVTIPPGAPPVSVTSTLTVPGNPRIEDLDVTINLNHTFMQDLDVHLISPAGNDNGVFTDVGAATVGGTQTLMDWRIDDEAALPFAFALSASMVHQPELAFRLNWFDGEDAGGTWTLQIRDDANGDGGTLNSWSLTICEPPPPPACPPGFVTQTVFTTDFESGDAGFTHSGTADQWARGLPNTPATGTANPPPVAAFTTCNSGVNCWKTNLTGVYSQAPTAGTNVTQDLLSPPINLAGLTPPVVVTWAQRYQMENATFDHMFIDAQQVGGATPVRLFEWLDATMTSGVGAAPVVNIGESAGWGLFSRRADSLAGLNTELRFHLDSDNSVNLAGLAIDDVTVTACRALSADLSITKTDGVATAVPGSSVTYTITASNAGPDPVTGATVADTFPAILTCTWTCVGAGGGTCTAAGSGNINDTVNLPAGGSVTYTATCTINASATGTLVNTATVSSGVTDPNPANNSATDTDTLTPQADLSITKTNGVTLVAAGGTSNYTITASNAGPSDAPGATVADTFPASLTCGWTCVGAGGGTCTAAGSGNINDTVNLPAGGSVTYTAGCNVSQSATGTLSNTATVAAPAGVTDPNPANNSATDTDTIQPTADLSITKTDGVTSATPGGSVTYTITASNPGASNATGATVTDTFPPSLTCTWTCVGAGGGTCTAAGSGNINDTVNLPDSGSITYTASCTISAAATGSLVNTATVVPPAGFSDPNLGNNSATDTDALGAEADLAITKTDGVTSVTAGGSTTYTIVASNAGPSGATGATVADTFPASLTCTWTCVGAGGGTCTAAGSGNINDTVNLPSGGSVTYTASCTISGSATGTIANTATVAAPAGVTDPNPANNSATDTDTVGAAPGVSISGTKTASGTFEAGSTVSYTIVLTNSGTSTQADNPGFEFTDTLPASLTLVGADDGGNPGTFANAGNTVNWNGSIAGGGGTVTITITATINAGTDGQTISNQGTFNFDADANGTNESSGTTDDPGQPGGPTPTAFVVGGGGFDPAIPTLSPLGMLLLAFVLAGLALVLMKRRRQA